MNSYSTSVSSNALKGTSLLNVEVLISLKISYAEE